MFSLSSQSQRVHLKGIFSGLIGFSLLVGKFIFYTLSSSLHWKMILKWLIISLYEICYTIHNFLLHFCSFKLLIICLFKDNTFEFRQLFFQKSEKNADLFSDVTVFENHQKSILRGNAWIVAPKMMKSFTICQKLLWNQTFFVNFQPLCNLFSRIIT